MNRVLNNAILSDNIN